MASRSTILKPRRAISRHLRGRLREPRVGAINPIFAAPELPKKLRCSGARQHWARPGADRPGG
eukprot:8653672-Prorocentrum_lima.AAC.1